MKLYDKVTIRLININYWIHINDCIMRKTIQWVEFKWMNLIWIEGNESYIYYKTVKKSKNDVFNFLFYHISPSTHLIFKCNQESFNSLETVDLNIVSAVYWSQQAKATASQLWALA